MFGFIKKIGRAVGSVTKPLAKVTEVMKPVATGVAIVYPPAAPIAAGVFAADKVLDAANAKLPKGVSVGELVRRRMLAAQQAAGQTTGTPATHLPHLPAPTQAHVQAYMAARRAAALRTIANTKHLAEQGDKNAARGLTLVAKRAAARKEASRWALRKGRVVRVRA